MPMSSQTRLALHAVLTACVVESSPMRPNIIMALVDDLGFHNVGWNNPDQISPNIDDLTKTGIVLERHYTYKYCSPSRSSFLSGRLPLHHNEHLPALAQKGGAQLGFTLLSQKLRDVGYATAAVGKWHIGARTWGNIPTARGFDHFLGFLGGEEDHFTQKKGSTVDLFLDGSPAFGLNGTDYSASLYGNEAVRIVQQHNASKPLFLYFAFQNAHEPYQVPNRYLDESVDYMPRAKMQGMVTAVDEALGNLTSALKTKGMWDNTLLVFSSDNGGPSYWAANNYPLRGTKWTDFEGGVRTAAFVSGGIIPKARRGQRSDEYLHIVDWYSTFCSLAGADAADPQPDLPDVDSLDMKDIIFNGTAKSPRTEIPLSSNAFIQGDYKLVLSDWTYKNRPQGYWTFPTWPIDNGRVPANESTGCPEDGCLFNIKKDPQERVELSVTEPELYASMLARMDELKKEKFEKFDDGPYTDCITQAESVDANKGFYAPICSKPVIV